MLNQMISVRKTIYWVRQKICGCFGHTWQEVGGRSCPRDLSFNCSQPVYQCSRCFEWDYGYKGGPGYVACVECCLERSFMDKF